MATEYAYRVCIWPESPSRHAGGVFWIARRRGVRAGARGHDAADIPARPGGSRMSAPVEFAVWAPLPERVRVQVDGTVHDMHQDDGGWWRAEVEADPDADYGYLVDDDETPRPDPRSRRQPAGVHGLSRRFDADTYAWGDGTWTGRPLAGRRADALLRG